MRFSVLYASLVAFSACVEAQTSTQVISGDGPPAPSLTRTAAVGSWTPKAASDGLPPASLDAMGRTIYINSATDFCLLMPPDTTKENLVDAEAYAVSYCTNPINGTRPMPDGFIKTAHFRTTPDYVQISGTYDATVMNLGTDDCGGEYDSEGSEGIGNPAGVTMRNGSYFSQFLGACDIPGNPVFCLRMCPDYEYCRNTFDLMGCLWVMPGDYDEPNAFTNCEANADLPVGVYNSSYTFAQGQSVTPTPVTAPSSSNCRTVSSMTASGVTYSWNQEAAAITSSSRKSGSSTPASASSAASSNQSGATATHYRSSLVAVGATAILTICIGGALLI